MANFPCIKYECKQTIIKFCNGAKLACLLNNAKKKTPDEYSL